MGRGVGGRKKHTLELLDSVALSERAEGQAPALFRSVSAFTLRSMDRFSGNGCGRSTKLVLQLVVVRLVSTRFVRNSRRFPGEFDCADCVYGAAATRDRQEQVVKTRLSSACLAF